MSSYARFRWFAAGLVGIAFALLGWPAVGSAAETFGSRLLNEPNYGGCQGLLAPCTYAAYIHPSDPDGDPYSGGAPSDGVIVKFRIRAVGPDGPGSPAEVTFGLAEINKVEADGSAATAKLVGVGPTVTVAGTGEIEEFPARLSVKKGDQLAINTSQARAIYASSGSKFTYAFSPALSVGGAEKASNQVTEELLVAAVIEPDTDGDGYGDETQDKCPKRAGSDEGCPTPDEADKSTAPRIANVVVLPRRAKGARSVTYRLNKAARVILRVERLAKGRRVGGKCRKPTRANRSGKACLRAVNVPGRIVRQGKKGPNQAVLPARIGGKALAPGAYRLVLVARDGENRRSLAVRAGFRVTR